MPFNENTDHSISLNDASKMTENYRKSASEVIAVAFAKNYLQGMLNQQDCIGLRMYFAKNEDGDMTLVLVGLDADGNDLYQGQLAQYGAACPPFCASSNPLNS